MQIVDYVGFRRRFVAHLGDLALVGLVTGALAELLFASTHRYPFYGIIDAEFPTRIGFWTWPLWPPIADFLFALQLSFVDTFYYYTDDLLLAIIWPSVLAIAYHVVLLSWKGQTVGKALLGVAVVGPDHRPPTLLRAALRETVGKAVSSIFYIGFLWIAFNERKRGLHDLIAGTEIVRVPVGFRRWRRSWRTAGEEVGH